MRMVAIVLSTVLLIGCNNVTNKPPGVDSSVDPATEPELSSALKEAIRQLVRKSDIIVLGKIVGIHDGTARDGGMSYDIAVEKQLHGKVVSGNTVRFRSAGWIGYAKYKKDEQVLLFLKYWQEEIIQVKPVCYISKQPPPHMGLSLWPLQNHLHFIESELEKEK